MALILFSTLTVLTNADRQRYKLRKAAVSEGEANKQKFQHMKWELGELGGVYVKMLGRVDERTMV